MIEIATLPIAFLLAVANKALVDYLADPIRAKYPNADLWWLVYVAFGTGALIGWFSGVNLFAVVQSMHPIVGRVLTACVIGGGSSLIHDIWDHPDVADDRTRY